MNKIVEGLKQAVANDVTCLTVARVIVAPEETLLFACPCGWTSYSKQYDLDYHADHHGCKVAQAKTHRVIINRERN